MRRYFSIRVLLPTVTGLMTLALVTIFAILALRAIERRDEVRQIPVIVDISYDLFAAIQGFRLERGAGNRALTEPEVAGSDALNELAELHASASKSLDSALTKLSAFNAIEAGSEIDEITRSRDAFTEVRRALDQALQQPRDKRPQDVSAIWFAANGRLVSAIDGLSGRLENELSQQGDSFVAEMIRIKQLIWSVRSDSGDDRAFLRQALTSGRPLSAAERRELDLLSGRIEGVWRVVQDVDRRPTTPAELRDAIDTARQVYFTSFRRVRNHVVEELSAGRSALADLPDWDRLSGPSRAIMVPREPLVTLTTPAAESLRSSS